MRKARIYDARQLPAYLRPAQYAELMSIDKKTVQKMCRSGLLPAEKVGPRLWRIDTNRAREQGKLNRPNKKPAGAPSNYFSEFIPNNIFIIQVIFNRI